MQRRQTIAANPLLWMLAAALLMLGYQALATRPHVTVVEEQIEPLKAAFIDIERVFNNLPALEEADREIQQFAEELEQREQQARDRAEQLEEELEMLEPMTDEYNDTMEALSTATVEYRTAVEFSRQKLETRRGRMLRDIYLEMSEAAAEFADRHGYDVIFIDDASPGFEPGTESMIQQQISARRTVHVSDRVDVTDELLEFIANR